MVADEWDVGCFAWSAARACAMCVVGHHSIQEGGSYAIEYPGCQHQPSMEFISWSDQRTAYGYQALVMDQDTRDAVTRQLRSGEFRELDSSDIGSDDELGTESRPDGGIDLPRGAVLRLEWQQDGIDDGDGMTGSWPIYSGDVELSCSGADKDFTPVMTPTHEADPQPIIGVQILPDGRHVIVSTATSYTVEGDSGTAFAVALLDLDKACP